MVYQGATGLYHFLINVIPFISNSVLYIIQCIHHKHTYINYYIYTFIHTPEFMLYIYTYIHTIYMGFDLSSSCFSLVFIKNLKTINKNTRKTRLLFLLYSRPLIVIYNM